MNRAKLFGYLFIGIGILAILGVLLFGGNTELNRGDNIPFYNNWVHVLGFFLIGLGAVFVFVFGKRNKG